MQPPERNPASQGSGAGRAPEFEGLRDHLAGLAYRMLGSVAESEDVVQDAWLRWHDVDRESVDNPKAFLTTVVTRLAIDRAKSAQRRREIYVGPWLPEPVVDTAPLAADPADEVAHDVSFALMLALERLSPLERAAFLLHDVFEADFDEIAKALDRNPAACRQLARRARDSVRAERPRYAIDPEEGKAIADAFFAASRSGNVDDLKDLLAESVTFHSDGGGRRVAALRVLEGAERVGRMYRCIARRNRGSHPAWQRRLTINGLPGELSLLSDGELQTVALEIADGRIHAIYVVRNPAKLEHLWEFAPT